MRRAGMLFVLAALAVLGGARAPAAADDAPTAFDPPDTQYFAGAEEPDPAAERRLAVVERYNAYLPVSIDLSGRMPAVGDQGKTLSSAAWAAAYAARSFYTATRERRDIRQPTNLPSPSYVDQLARQGGCDRGTDILRVAAVLRKGALSLADSPFTQECAPRPRAQIVAAARDFRVQNLRRVDARRLDDVKGELAQSNPVIVRFRTSRAFFAHRGDATFSEASSAAGSDAVWQFLTLVGYDERRQAFRLINSWGRGWGDNGYAWVSYDLVKTRVSQAYVLVVASPKQPAAASEPATTASTAPPQLSDLENLLCARVSVRSADGHTTLDGFVASDRDLAQVKRVAASGSGISLGSVLVAPWPRCEAFLTLGDSVKAAERPSIIVDSDGPYRAGDTLRFAIRFPAKANFSYVTYVQADHSVINLMQPKSGSPQPTAANTLLLFGDGKDARPRFTVSEPFGHEMIVALASSAPLFAEDLPMRQSAREYLSALRKAMFGNSSAMRAGGEVGADIKMLETRGH